MDLLGRRVQVYGCPYPLRGLAVGETHGLLFLLTEGGVKAVPKLPCSFLVELEGGCLRLVRGRDVVGHRDRRLAACRSGA